MAKVEHINWKLLYLLRLLIRSRHFFSRHPIFYTRNDERLDGDIFFERSNLLRPHFWFCFFFCTYLFFICLPFFVSVWVVFRTANFTILIYRCVENFVPISKIGKLNISGLPGEWRDGFLGLAVTYYVEYSTGILMAQRVFSAGQIWNYSRGKVNWLRRGKREEPILTIERVHAALAKYRRDICIVPQENTLATEHSSELSRLTFHQNIIQWLEQDIGLSMMQRVGITLNETR